MADDVTLNSMSGGSVVAADDVSSVFYQKIKLDLGTDGVSAAAVAGAGAVSTGVQRTTLASDDPAVALLGTIDTDTGNIAGDTSTIAGAVAAGQMQVDVVAALPSGTNGIGKLTANSGVDIGDVDVTSLPDAVVDVNYFSATITSANASAATQVKAKTAAKKIYVTSVVISVGSTAIEVQLQSDNGTPQVVMEEMFFAANGGMALSACDPKMPLFIVNTNEDLDVITSAAGDVTVTVAGYVV